MTPLINSLSPAAGFYSRVCFAAALGVPGNPAARKQVLFVFGEHAREVITSEVGLWFGRLLVKDSKTNVAAWPELHSGLARVMDEPKDGWEQYIGSAIDQVLSQVVVQVRWAGP
jgi:hypothetical protein